MIIKSDVCNFVFTISIHDKEIKNTSEVEPPSITIDSQLKFKKHIDNLCRKASYKLHALRKICNFLTVENFVKFTIDQVIHKDYQKSYDELLEINKDVNTHQKHLRIFALEVFKRIMHFNPEFMWITSM